MSKLYLKLLSALRTMGSLSVSKAGWFAVHAYEERYPRPAPDYSSQGAPRQHPEYLRVQRPDFGGVRNPQIHNSIALAKRSIAFSRRAMRPRKLKFRDLTIMVAIGASQHTGFVR